MNTLRNKVQLIGHLGADPEIKTTPAGSKVANLRMATSEPYFSNGVWKEDTQWHTLVLWEKLAERAEKQLHKGSHIMLEGRLTHRNYEDAKGIKRYFTEVKGSSFILLDKKENGSSTGISQPEALVEEEADLPF
jgi:single-strand DNA-binding protein